MSGVSSSRSTALSTQIIFGSRRASTSHSHTSAPLLTLRRRLRLRSTKHTGSGWQLTGSARVAVRYSQLGSSGVKTWTCWAGLGKRRVQVRRGKVEGTWEKVGEKTV